jgi:uncharacterized membrane protein (DUF373 family)
MDHPFHHLKLNPKHWFDRITGAIFGVILVFIMLGMVIGTVRLFLSLVDLASEPGVTGRYLNLVSDILTLFILVELSRSLVEYFNTLRLRLTFIVDAAIVFLLREVMIKTFEHRMETQDVYAISALLLVLGALRIGSVMVFQREKAMMDTIERERRREARPPDTDAAT